ncbi:MAG: helicase-related protein [Syntrophales bacterium]|nr:helicase-related protein [Syntrophales bacterium]
MIHRYSSRRSPLKDFLATQLQGALRYDRIAGFFSSSLLEVAGEALERMTSEGGETCVRVVCNSCLNPLDVQTARAAKWGMHREWCASLPAEIGAPMKARLQRLHDFLSSGLLKVKVLPDEAFGLIHGKAGVITRTDGSRVCFIGSANESRTAWVSNYELVWLDESEEGVRWVQEEFDALWSSPQAVDLAEAVVQDVARLIHRVVVPDIDAWKKEEAKPAEPIVELPIYRRENGLWAHQKSFINLAFDAHKNGGARYLLADQVGLGKTVQLALDAKLMALYGEKPILILVPRPLMIQWQEELWSLLAMPSARWTGKQWIDEQGVVYADLGAAGLRKCPRKVGIVSTGLIIRGSEGVNTLKELSYECVILDEAHRARRSNLGPTHRGEKAEPNNLLQFLMEIAPRTRSLLLATATPVQLDPIEAWDLLGALNSGKEFVLGSLYSRWLSRPLESLSLILETVNPPEVISELWEWIRDPLPPSSESKDFELIRRGLKVSLSETWSPPEAFEVLPRPDQQRVRRLSKIFFQEHNPFIRHIIRRTRDFLENTINPQTNEPYLQTIKVRLFGEDDKEVITLPPFLSDAYEAAEEFCSILARRPGLNSGFMKTILLRRVGSTIEAGRLTAIKMLGPPLERDQDDEEGEDERDETLSSLYPLTKEERFALTRFLKILDENRDEDPKLRQVETILSSGVPVTGGWLSFGCIIFSQYYGSVFWLGQRLSKRLPGETIAIYANISGSGIIQNGVFQRINRDEIKRRISAGELRLVIGTDAASEGLNLQRLGSLINLDLPWNPTRLEQRKGRIQRIGQVRPEVLIYNMRYKGSVEDRVHQLLSERLANIRNMFGQIPDTLEDVWVWAALREEELAKQVIDEVPRRHPFEMKYDRIENVEWESCSRVLDSLSQIDLLQKGW